MNKVISGYFDDAHRSLQRQHSGAQLHKAPSNVELPPLRPSSGEKGAISRDVALDSKVTMGSSAMLESKSMGSLEYSHEHVSRGVQLEQLNAALQDSSKLARKVRALQDQLAITSAKKEAFKAQAQRLEREFKKGREQTDMLQKDLLDAKRETNELNKDAQEAIAMMGEMRKAHIQEVKLLQRGLNQRNGDKDSRNRVNEMADLVDKVGRAVVQRDEAIRDKTKMEAQLKAAMSNLHSASDDVAKFKKQNQQLSKNLKEAKRRGQYVPPKPREQPDEDSDEDFELELQQLEKRFEILEEGPAGLDVLASNLSKDKQELEKRVKQQQQTIKSLTRTIEDWKLLGQEKDNQIKDLNGKLEKVMRDQAIMEEQIAQKQRDIELQVAEEKAALEARVQELEMECDNARAAADGMEKASTRLGKELVKVHEQYSGAPPPAAAGAVTGDSASAAPPPPAAGPGKSVAAAQNLQAKTGEKLHLEAFRDGEAVELRAREAPSGKEMRIPVPAAIVKELDETDPWNDLFSRTGVDPGPPRQVVISSRLGEKEVKLKPANTPLILTAYRYSDQRYYLAGMDIATQQLLSLSITEASLPPPLAAQLKACKGNDAIFNALAAAVRLSADGKTMSLE